MFILRTVLFASWQGLCVVKSKNSAGFLLFGSILLRPDDMSHARWENFWVLASSISAWWLLS